MQEAKEKQEEKNERGGEKEMKNKSERQKGITLIALVITIIVLLILAAVSIATLTGENGILGRAGEARDKTGRAQVVEDARLAVLDIQIQNDGKISEDNFKGVLAEYFQFDPDTTELTENWPNLTLTSKDGKYSGILAKEIYNGSFGEEENGGTTKPITELKVGDYVKYGDKLTKQTYTTNIAQTGYENQQIFETNTETLWQVLSIDESEVKIIAVENTLSNNSERIIYKR